MQLDTKNTPLTLLWTPHKSCKLNFLRWLQGFIFKAQGIFFSSKKALNKNNNAGMQSF